LVCSSRSAI